jgi:hypothetical protein
MGVIYIWRKKLKTLLKWSLIWCLLQLDRYYTISYRGEFSGFLFMCDGMHNIKK